MGLGPFNSFVCLFVYFKFLLPVISICFGLGRNLEFFVQSRNNFQGFLKSLPRVPNTPEFVCLFVFDLVTYMYTGIATH